MSGKEPIEQLSSIQSEIVMLSQTANVLHWDMETQLASGGVAQRAEQLAYISGLIHTKATHPRVGELIGLAEQQAGTLDAVQRQVLRVARRDYDQAVRLPQAHVEAVSRETGLANHVWAKARAENRFEDFRPHLEKLVELNRQAAEYLGYSDHPYDALLDGFEQGMTVAQLDQVFGEMRQGLVKLVASIAAVPQVRNDFLTRGYPADKQREFGEKVARDIGYDFSRGFLGISAHPFTIELSSDDVRITTRYDEHFLPTALFGIIHEAGHALYEQGFPSGIKNTVLASGTSLGVHESQSRFWENTVGRSRVFWQRYYKDLCQAFPAQLADVDLETFYRGINTVAPTLIRVEADEVTYGLHVIVRYEIENKLIAGTLAVKDLPEAWNARMQE
ncbi:MAG: carboxypeptidase M32 [Spirochaetaceae bacterium]|nr:MAG: carboxypeptidase M32 [Spirochaetaceae bacterium]